MDESSGASGIQPFFLTSMNGRRPSILILYSIFPILYSIYSMEIKLLFNVHTCRGFMKFHIIKRFFALGHVLVDAQRERFESTNPSLIGWRELRHLLSVESDWSTRAASIDSRSIRLAPAFLSDSFR